MDVKFNIYVFTSLLFLREIRTFQFEDITKEIFPAGEDNGVLAAYGHFNNDEFTDIVTLQHGGHKLQFLSGSEDRPYFKPSFNCSFDVEEGITSIVPGDFNGDSLLDVLATFSKPKSNVSEVRIFWGNGDNSVICKSKPQFILSEQPFVLDFNGDMIPDIIGEALTGERYVWISSTNKTFFKHELIPASGQMLKKPHSSGLVDINNDLVADLLMTGTDNIEVWLNTGQTFIANTTIPYPEHAQQKWQSTFIDFNMDGQFDHIIPICYDWPCLKSAIKIWNANDSQWYTLLDNFYNPNEKNVWGFRLPKERSVLEQSTLFPTLRFGDIDMDGYTDFLTVLQSKSIATDVRTVILKNIPCESCITGRRLEIIWEVPGLKDLKNVQLASFFDLFEDGVLDIIVSIKQDKKSKILALKNTEIIDSCFLKVLVLSGLCCSRDCLTEPYGVNQPGPVVRYNMTKEDGQPVVGYAVQLSQSAHFPLQLPYTLFGLGPTPNFIDVLTVSVPAKFNKTAHKREWLQIIPNSQIVVIPSPPNDSTKWVKKLFVTPSRLVMLTCIALIVTCIFIALLVALLHWKERREDKKEKMQDAYRFPFDAM